MYVGLESHEVTCVGSSEPHKLGPLDKWTRVIDPKATKAESLKQQQLNKELWKERTHEVHKYIARWAYNHGKLLLYYSHSILQDVVILVLN
jgi:N-formylglutamate amidohydrolase